MAKYSAKKLLKPLPPRLLEMHKAYGGSENPIPGLGLCWDGAVFGISRVLGFETRFCGECEHLERHRAWFKCAKTRQSGCTATDWRVNWPACGLFKETEENNGKATTTQG
jgi:hypothetical protein